MSLRRFKWAICLNISQGSFSLFFLIISSPYSWTLGVQLCSSVGAGAAYPHWIQLWASACTRLPLSILLPLPQLSQIASPPLRLPPPLPDKDPQNLWTCCTKVTCLIEISYPHPLSLPLSLSLLHSHTHPLFETPPSLPRLIPGLPSFPASPPYCGFVCRLWPGWLQSTAHYSWSFLCPPWRQLWGKIP